MARHPAFERSEVVHKAMQVFWRSGYQGASIKLLGDAMGLKPGSIYAAFGSKEELFREALAAYVARIRGYAEASRLGPRQILERWFAAHIEASLGDPEGSAKAATNEAACGRGCLLLNSASELPGVDGESAAIVRAELRALEDYFYACVVAARGSRPRDTTRARATARLLVAALGGISMMSRAGVTRSALRDVARAALAAI
jgi:TetR/AcrR family transcriptional repressor of nem operon